MNEIKNKCYPVPFHIAGVGRYLPKRLVTGSELAAAYGLEVGWCENYLGVCERRWADDETPSYMGAEAAREAVANAGIDLEDLDLIINASSTASFERGIPDGGPLLQKQLGLEESGIAAFTLQNYCLSFMTALDLCAILLNTGRYNNILIASAEILSRNLDSNDPHVIGRFGDGAAAAVVTLPPEGVDSCIHYARFETHGQYADVLHSPMGITSFLKNKNRGEELTLKLDASSFEKYSIEYTQKLLKVIFENSGHTAGDIDIVIPQQSGKVYLDYLDETVPGNKVIRVLDRFGFCGAASFPMALVGAVKEEKLKRGDRFLLIGTGAGISVGGMVMTY